MKETKLKFRAWDGEEMREWGFVRGGFVSPPSESGGHDYPMMQYTGMKDVKGKDIFEGDIVNASTSKNGEKKPMYVYWSEERCEFATSDYKNEGGWFPSIRHDSFLFFEVIGNIYQNKDLLKK